MTDHHIDTTTIDTTTIDTTTIDTTTIDARIAVVQDAYRAINAHDLAALGALLADDCVRQFVRGDAPIAGDHVGRDAVLASYRYVFELTGDDHHCAVANVLANHALVASYHQETGTRQRDGRTLDAPMLVRWEVDGGRITRIRDYANDVPGLNAFLR
jgi:ketosteroid isomerase-like protein